MVSIKKIIDFIDEDKFEEALDAAIKLDKKAKNKENEKNEEKKNTKI